MKKTLSAIFLAIMMFFVTACGNSSSSNVSPPAEPSQESSSVSQPSKPAQSSSASSSSTTEKKSDKLPDVPKDHWAYNSVSLLSGAGVDEGYGDGTFRGDNPRTRYEAARLLAKLHMFLKKAKR